MSMVVRAFWLILCAAGLALGTGCAKKVDRVTVDRIIARGMAYEDIDRLCAVGDALGIPMAGLGISQNALKAQVLANVSAALCLEPVVREAQIDGAIARRVLSGEQKVAAVLDARYREERAHTRAAYRYKQAWDALEAEYGPIGEACPRIRDADQLVFLMGLYAGLHGMLHDQAGGGHVGVSFDTLGKVARGTACIDNERLWHVPGAFKAAAWATLLYEDEGDPWAMLEAEAAAGEASGVRLARAVQVMILANADRTDALRDALQAHARSLEQTPTAPEWAAMDQYALDVSRHELDRLWAAAEGHRAPSFGALPGGAEEAGEGNGPFAADPFAGGDPFGGGEEATDGAEGSGDDAPPDSEE
ncbi:MAG: hypothetical protein D6798_17960 [Deltaproteobacteria bacterium]|nr:MAG: hypothetical protein D6798_17960 [Deltaproteobacteria bacterium]